jgi:ribosome-associated translation inhibitor RaiA
MAKQKLVEINMFSKLLDLFFTAKSKNKENQFLNKIKDSDEDVWKAFDDINAKIDASTKRLNKYNSKFKDIDFSDLD